jgi:hypothetical protein
LRFYSLLEERKLKPSLCPFERQITSMSKQGADPGDSKIKDAVLNPDRSEVVCKYAGRGDSMFVKGLIP